MAGETIDSVYRDFKTPGNPDSGDYKPEKPRIRALLRRIQGASGQAVTKNTLAQLEAVTPPNEDYMGIVLTGEEAGFYSRSGGAWVFGRGFPDTFARITLAGTANAQTGSVGSGVNPSDVEVYYAVVTTPNTGPMTLSISGETARDVVNAAGNALSAGEWTGVPLFRLNSAGDYQLIINPGAEAAAAQSATDAAASASAANTDANRAEAAAASVVTRAWFKTVANLLADNNTVIGYAGSGAQFEVAAGDIVEAQGFRYEVADSAAVDEHVTTAGGVKLYVLPGSDGSARVKAFGLAGDGTEDDSDPFEAAIRVAATDGLPIVADGDERIRLTRAISATLLDKDFDLDLRGATIAPEFSLGVNSDTVAVVNVSTGDSTMVPGLRGCLKNYRFDGSGVPYHENTSGSDRRGITPFRLAGAEYVYVRAFAANDCFYGYGLQIVAYRFADIAFVDLVDVGAKFNPTSDDTGAWDAAGDGIYLGDATGDAQTIISNVSMSSYPAKYGRGGIVIEDLNGVTVSHDVIIHNWSPSRYHRALHCEDNGKVKVTWIGGRSTDNPVHLFALEPIKPIVVERVSFDVDGAISYGGNRGLINLFGASEDAPAIFKDCDINVHGTGGDGKGPAIFENCRISVAVAIAYDFPWSFRNCDLTFTDAGLIWFSSGLGRIRVEGGTVTATGGAPREVLKAESGYAFDVQGRSIWTDAWFQSIGSGQLPNRFGGGSELIITQVGGAVVAFNNAFEGKHILDGAHVRADSCRVRLYGDGGADWDVRSSDLLNVELQFVGGGGDAEGRDTCQVVGSKFAYDDAYAATEIHNLFSPYVVYQSNMFIDKTTAQNITTPADAGNAYVADLGNVMVKNSGLTKIVTATP